MYLMARVQLLEPAVPLKDEGCRSSANSSYTRRVKSATLTGLTLEDITSTTISEEEPIPS